METLSDAEVVGYIDLWETWARPDQLPPARAADGGEWLQWVIMGGRGAGKTRTGAEWVRGVALGVSAQTVTFAPPNSVVFISDVNGGQVPEIPSDISTGLRIWATPSCITVLCYPEVDGPTNITFGSGDDISRAAPPDFDQLIATPSGHLIVDSSGPMKVFSARVPSLRTRVRVWVWVNHPKWPDKVVIAYG